MYKRILLAILGLLIISCSQSKKGGPFNYELVKSKLDLDQNQTELFDKIEEEHTTKIKTVFEGEGTKIEKLKKAKAISAEQDQAIKNILSDTQFKIYEKEIAIEREGREKHNMQLILNQLQLDSLQTVQYNMANKAFYTTLVDNHDYYHGKPDVYRQYYREIDLNRQKVFKRIMTQDQYETYKSLEKEYKIGQSEH
ncbi:MAG: hypothetical protein H6584_05060 [Flavobacteriales bacterium]|nr:hypothetical protein [Flavobacteriales bacterium]